MSTYGDGSYGSGSFGGVRLVPVTDLPGTLALDPRALTLTTANLHGLNAEPHTTTLRLDG